VHSESEFEYRLPSHTHYIQQQPNLNQHQTKNKSADSQEKSP
jgi:hypothetical protein